MERDTVPVVSSPALAIEVGPPAGPLRLRLGLNAFKSRLGCRRGFMLLQ